MNWTWNYNSSSWDSDFSSESCTIFFIAKSAKTLLSALSGKNKPSIYLFWAHTIDESKIFIGQPFFQARSLFCNNHYVVRQTNWTVWSVVAGFVFLWRGINNDSIFSTGQKRNFFAGLWQNKNHCVKEILNIYGSFSNKRSHFIGNHFFFREEQISDLEQLFVNFFLQKWHV